MNSTNLIVTQHLHSLRSPFPTKRRPNRHGRFRFRPGSRNKSGGSRVFSTSGPTMGLLRMWPGSKPSPSIPQSVPSHTRVERWSGLFGQVEGEAKIVSDWFFALGEAVSSGMSRPPSTSSRQVLEALPGGAVPCAQGAKRPERKARHRETRGVSRRRSAGEPPARRSRLRRASSPRRPGAASGDCNGPAKRRSPAGRGGRRTVPQGKPPRTSATARVAR